MDFTSITNLRWANRDQTEVVCTIYSEELLGNVHMHGRKDDKFEDSRTFFEAAVRGDFGPIGDPLPETLPPPAPISDRQFFQALAMNGIITEEDALAAVRTGFIPSPIQAIVDAMPAENQFAATMLLAGATSFEFTHPLVEVFTAAQGWTLEQTRAFFEFAAKL